MALYLDIGVGDVLRVGDNLIALERKTGSRARLRIVGTAEVQLERKKDREAAPSAQAPRQQPRQDTGD